MRNIRLRLRNPASDRWNLCAQEAKPLDLAAEDGAESGGAAGGAAQFVVSASNSSAEGEQSTKPSLMLRSATDAERQDWITFVKATAQALPTWGWSRPAVRM